MLKTTILSYGKLRASLGMAPVSKARHLGMFLAWFVDVSGMGFMQFKTICNYMKSDMSITNIKRKNYSFNEKEYLGIDMIICIFWYFSYLVTHDVMTEINLS